MWQVSASWPILTVSPDGDDIFSATAAETYEDSWSADLVRGFEDLHDAYDDDRHGASFSQLDSEKTSL